MTENENKVPKMCNFVGLFQCLELLQLIWNGVQKHSCISHMHEKMNNFCVYKTFINVSLFIYETRI